MAEDAKPVKPKKEKHNKSKFYEVKGGTVERKKKSCPKCGPAAFLAEHKDRLTCGTCSYTEWKKNE